MTTSPFPGMNPYLELPSMWPDVHGSLTLTIREQLQPLISPRYAAVLTPYIAYEAIDIATSRMMVPDVGVFEEPGRPSPQEGVAIAPAPLTGLIEVPTRYYRIEIVTVGDERLVTVIEILSPANKRPGANAADAYERKRQDVLQSAAHLLEIDLLRGGRRPSLVTPLPAAPYFLMLSRVQRRPEVEIWPLSLRAAIPIVPVPLAGADPDVPLDLTAALQRIYANARYDLRIDYTQPPPPPELAPDDAAWLAAHLQAAGVRQEE
jgi:hypothetical protein